MKVNINTPKIKKCQQGDNKTSLRFLFLVFPCWRKQNKTLITVSLSKNWPNGAYIKHLVVSMNVFVCSSSSIKIIKPPAVSTRSPSEHHRDPQTLAELVNFIGK